MAVQAGFSQVAAALADPAREAILAALADGRALPAGELARIADVSPQSASAHLQRLTDCSLLAVWTQGRFRHYRLAGDQAAEIIEALADFACSLPSARPRRQAAPADVGFARCCYSHLAGALGVGLTDLLVRRGYVRLASDHAELTVAGEKWAAENGFLENSRHAGRPALRLCLDWTERRHHLAGPVAAAILRHLLAAGHLRRGRQRALQLTPSGKAWFAALGRRP